MTELEETAVSASDCEDEEYSAKNSENSESWGDDYDSEVSDAEDIKNLSQFDDRFRAAVDRKIRNMEKVCDNQHYVFSFAPPLCPGANDKPPPDSQAISHIFNGASSPRGPGVSDIESARDEIAQLRTAREVFVSHKTEAADRLKKEDCERDTRWLYECEEVVEAIDTIIDFKNEIICGRQENSSPSLFPERQGEDSDAELMMSRLVNLSSDEQLKLFCKFFNKVVELRHSSKQLEKNSDKLLDEHDDMFRVLKHYKRKLRKQEEAYSDHLKLLTLNHPGAQERPDEDARSHRHTFRTNQAPSMSQRHRHNYNNGELFDSVRDRQRHYAPGPEITRDIHKIRIHAQQNQNSHLS